MRKNHNIILVCYFNTMGDVYLVALVASIVYVIFRFIEMRFIDKTDKPLKSLVKDTLWVYLSIVFSNYIYDEFAQEISLDSSSVPTEVFTNAPDF